MGPDRAAAGDRVLRQQWPPARFGRTRPGGERFRPRSAANWITGPRLLRLGDLPAPASWRFLAVSECDRAGELLAAGRPHPPTELLAVGQPHPVDERLAVGQPHPFAQLLAVGQPDPVREQLARAQAALPPSRPSQTAMICRARPNVTGR